MTPQVPSPDDTGGGGSVDLSTLEACCADTNAAITNLTAELDQVEELLTAIGANTDGLEACCATTNGNLTTIIGHVDGLEALLTAIGTNTDGLEGQLTTIIGHVDGLEALGATTNATLATISTSVDGLETLATATNALLTTIDGRVDGLEALSTAANVLLTTISASVDGLEALITTTNTHLQTLAFSTYLEDSAHISGDRGTFLLGVRNDADAVRTSADGDYSPVSTDNKGRVKTLAADTDSLLTQILAATGGLGISVYRNINLQNVGQVIKGSSGRVLTIHVANLDGANDHFLKLYNKATAPTAADTPVMTIPLEAPANGNVTVLNYNNGILFNLGIGVRATTGIADGDNGAPGANDVVVNIGYA